MFVIYQDKFIYIALTKVSSKGRITEQFHIGNQFFSKRMKL